MFSKFYSNNCTTSIVDYDRSHSNFCYDLCLICCCEFREDYQPGGDEEESTQQQSQEGVSALTRDNLGALARRYGWESSSHALDVGIEDPLHLYMIVKKTMMVLYHALLRTLFLLGGNAPTSPTR